LNAGIQILIFAISPALALAIYFYRKDKYEKEPSEFLIRAFLGGVVAAFMAIAIEIVLIPFAAYFKVAYFPNIAPAVLHFLKIFFISFLVYGLVEEWCKYREFQDVVYGNDNFNEPFDGILYSVMIALGFATLENLGYVIKAYFKFGIGFMAGVGIGRAIFSVPGHCCFAVIMGYYFGKAKFARKKRLRSRYLFKAFLYAVIVHGLFDFLIMIKTAWGGLFFLLLVLWSWDFAFRAIKEEVGESPFRNTGG
jgi:RsiW-degrading membrane proteinase PrsW (M82 family)